MAAAEVPSWPAMICPILRYRDARAALRFLADAFGGTVRFVVPESGDFVRHAQVQVGSGVVMVGTVRPGERLASPGSSGSATHALYVSISDVDAHHSNAVAHGASIRQAPYTNDLGFREYSVADVEGYLWVFGSYRPEAELPRASP